MREGRKELRKEGKEGRERTNSFSLRLLCAVQARTEFVSPLSASRAAAFFSTETLSTGRTLRAQTRRAQTRSLSGGTTVTEAGETRTAAAAAASAAAVSSHRPYSAHRGPWRAQATARTRTTGASSPRCTTAAASATSPTAATTARASPTCGVAASASAVVVA